VSRNEAETRFDLIDPALFECGWERPNVRIEETLPAVDIVYGKGRRRPKGRTDYVLRRPLALGTEPMPLAIIEAKREGLPPEHELQEGREYRTRQLHHVLSLMRNLELSIEIGIDHNHVETSQKRLRDPLRGSKSLE